jgi:WD40 repeat protein
VLEGHSSKVNSVAISGDVRVSGSYDKTVRVWDIRNGQLLHVFERHSEEVKSVAISADGSTIVSRCHDKIIIWNAPTGERLAKDVRAGFIANGGEISLEDDQNESLVGPSDSTEKIRWAGATFDEWMIEARMSLIDDTRFVCGRKKNTAMIR